MKALKEPYKDSRLTLHSGSSKSSSRVRRSYAIAGTKRRYGMKFRQRKRRGAQGRYGMRRETRRRQFASPESPKVFRQGYDQAYIEDFKAGFAQGYEDGPYAAAASSMPYRRSDVE